MPLDTNFLIALLGMVLAVAVTALFMRGKKSSVESDAAPAAAEVLFEDAHAQFRRYTCPDCGQLLRQEIHLNASKPRAQVVRAESGYPPGEVTCPACGQRSNLTSMLED